MASTFGETWCSNSLPRSRVSEAAAQFWVTADARWRLGGETSVRPFFVCAAGACGWGDLLFLLTVSSGLRYFFRQLPHELCAWGDVMTAQTRIGRLPPCHRDAVVRELPGLPTTRMESKEKRQ